MWKPLSGFQAAVDGALSVHGGGSVHAVVELKDDVRANFHHLTGHYRRLRQDVGPSLRGAFETEVDSIRLIVLYYSMRADLRFGRSANAPGRIDALVIDLMITLRRGVKSRS